MLAGLHRQDSSDTLLLAFYLLCVFLTQVEVWDSNIMSDAVFGAADIDLSKVVS